MQEYLFPRTLYSVRDALYGSVPLSEAAYHTLDATAFQRLKHVKQLGPAYLVYPGGTHTRFSHSIGVYHLTRLALQHLTALIDIVPEVGRATLAAALLHDLGHFPYSHVLDEISVGGEHLDHVALSVDLIRRDSELGGVLRQDWQVDPALVADLVGGRPNPAIPRCLYTLIDGPMDMDKLDYLNRDAHHTGVPYGKVEVQRLIEFLGVERSSGELVITESGIGTVESVIFAKYLMFRYVYWHHTGRIAATMINRAVLDCVLALGLQRLSVLEPRLQQVCLATDATLPEVLRRLLWDARVPLPPTFSLLERVETRRLFKRAVTVPCAEAGGLDAAYRDSLAKREREDALSQALGCGILIDVPPTAKFAANVRGIAREGDGEGQTTVAWDAAPHASYLTQDTVAAMEQSIRSVLYLYDPEAETAPAARAALLREAQG